MNESVTEALRMRDVENAKKKKRRQRLRRGKKSYYEGAIDEASEHDSEKSDKYAQNLVPTNFDGRAGSRDMMTMAMQLEKDRSLTSLWDLSKAEQERLKSIDPTDIMNTTDLMGGKMSPPMNGKGIELSRVSGDLDFSEEEDIAFQKDPEAKRLAEKVKVDNVQAWIKDENDRVHQRNFNINDILGRFKRDWQGNIEDRDQALRDNHFRDLDGNIVNERGYLIDESTGDVRSRYTFEKIFPMSQLIGLSTGGNKYELPLPLRLEKHNFNPHECMGNLEYDENEKPIFLKDRFGNRIDKNLRPVNPSGWLVDEEGNIIDNIGHVKFVKEQLTEKGDLPKLLNFQGKEYKIKNIIGIFDRDSRSKAIIPNQPKKASKYRNRHDCVDLWDRKVNTTGYLLDDRGNIIDKQGNIIWRSHELMYNEPPKIFAFTEFSINWIKGRLDKDVTLNPRHDDKYDLDGRLINTLGYLIDADENIVDTWNGNVVFKKEVLEQRFGQEAEIPIVYRSGRLKQPDPQTD